VCGTIAGTQASFTAYEMHIGVTTGPGLARPFARLDGGELDGTRSANGRVAGTYLHGIFQLATSRRALLAIVGAMPRAPDQAHTVEAALDALAAHLETYVDITRLVSLAR
jgi:adenosylcobyric acid synthase